jgi:hypothetical protein
MLVEFQPLRDPAVLSSGSGRSSEKRPGGREPRPPGFFHRALRAHAACSAGRAFGFYLTHTPLASHGDHFKLLRHAPLSSCNEQNKNQPFCDRDHKPHPLLGVLTHQRIRSVRTNSRGETPMTGKIPSKSFLMLAAAALSLTFASTLSQPAHADAKDNFKQGCESGHGSYGEDVNGVFCNSSGGVHIACDKNITHCTASSGVKPRPNRPTGGVLGTNTSNAKPAVTPVRMHPLPGGISSPNAGGSMSHHK